MSGNGRQPDDPQAILDHIADEVTERFRGGERPCVDDYVRRYPQFVDELEKIFSAIAALRASRADDAE